MLHLAEVVKNIVSHQLELHLLAVEESKLKWTFCHEQFMALDNNSYFPEGALLHESKSRYFVSPGAIAMTR